LNSIKYSSNDLVCDRAGWRVFSAQAAVMSIIIIIVDRTRSTHTHTQ